MEGAPYKGGAARLSNFPAAGPLLSKAGARGWLRRMIKRGDILYLGLASGVIGSLVGGMLLGVGMSLIIGGAPIGWLLLLPAAPAGGVPGWVLAKRLARNLP
jgi:hypothetical protein